MLSKHLLLPSTRGQTALQKLNWWAELIEGQCASWFFLPYMMRLPFRILGKKRKRKEDSPDTHEAHERTEGQITLNNPTVMDMSSLPASLEISGVFIC